MGTRADFYAGYGENAEWIGSIAWDGYPKGISKAADDKTSSRILESTTEENYREAVAQYLAHREDATAPEHGWPWPWDDSNTTDYAYCFDDGAVRIFSFGSEVPKKFRKAVLTEKGALWDEWCERDSSTTDAVFPDMSKRKKVTFGKRSGLLVLGT